jgi:K(+)-stimulated pyrophosphate-energized sodium pump
MEIYLVLAIGVLALLFSTYKSSWVGKQSAGEGKMTKIAGHIADGALAFLKAEYRVLAFFVVAIALLLAFTAHKEASHWSIGIAFVIGAVLSAFAGFLGMKIATKSNVRTTQAAKSSLSKALDVSFGGGMVMGINVVALGILGITILFLILLNSEAVFGTKWEIRRVLEVMIGFSLGAESIALFARVGGGIYTKAADVGADLVGKVEAGIPEDDPRNPAVIADNVGDNVGDVAGMGADLFGSYVSTILATMVLGTTVSEMGHKIMGVNAAIVLPLLIAALGLIFSVVGSFFVRIGETGNPQRALNFGNFGAVIMMAIASYFLINNVLDESITIHNQTYSSLNIFLCIIIGLVVGTLISLVVEYYTGKSTSPVKYIARQSITGGATNIIAGLSIGMFSTAIPVVILSAGIIAAFETGGLYGVAIAATGMMATTGIQLAIDAFGPIADNAGGIAEMSGLPKEVRERTDVLDSVGNTTAAIGKGFAIASAALTSLAMFSAYKETAHLDIIDISDAKVLGGLLVGGMIPFLFSGFAIQAVGQSANAMVEEVRRQFREIKGIMEGTAEAEYEKCVDISTKAALRHMIIPGALALLSPVVIALVLGKEGLGGFLSGVLVSGIMMAFFQSNAGGAWDNAKKMFEKGVDIKGKTYYKGSDPHKAAVIGDTVGDPFKDTSGPSLNILIKLVAIVATVIAQILFFH